MAYPSNAQELDQILGTMQSKGAPPEAMQKIVDQFKQNEFIKNTPGASFGAAIASNPTIKSIQQEAQKNQMIKQKLTEGISSASNVLKKTFTPPTPEESTQEVANFEQKLVNEGASPEEIETLKQQYKIGKATPLQILGGNVQQGLSTAGEGLKSMWSAGADTGKMGGGFTDVVGGLGQIIFSPVAGAVGADIPVISSGVKMLGDAINLPAEKVGDLGVKLFELGGWDINSDEFKNEIEKPLREALNVATMATLMKAGDVSAKLKQKGAAPFDGAEVGFSPVEKVMAPLVKNVGFLGEAAKIGTVGALWAAGKAVKKLPETAKNIIETRKSNKFIKLKDSIAKDIDSFIEGNKSFSRKANELSKGGVNIKENLSDPFIYEGLKVENGVVNPDASINTIQNKIDLLMDAKSSVLPKVSKFTPSIPKEVYRAKALESLKTEGLTPADANKAIARLDEQLAALPDELSIENLDQLRAQARKSARNAKGEQKPHSEYTALENSAREAVFDATDNLLIDRKGEFAALNTQIKSLIETVKFLDKNLRGAKVKGGRMGKITGRIIGSIAGTPGGMIGSIIGSEVGAVVSDIVMNNQLGSSLKMKLIKNMVDDPAALSQIEALVNEIKTYQPPQLEAPTSEFRTQYPSGKIINLPKETQSTIDQNLPLDSRQKAYNTPNKIKLNNVIDPTIPQLKGKVKPFKQAETPQTTNALIEEAKKYKSAEEFSQKYLKDLADENRGIYDMGVYDKFKEASGVPLYKTDWLPNKVNSLSRQEIDKIVAKYPERVKQLSQPKKWGNGTIKSQPYEVEGHILFEHFKTEYDNQVKKGLTDFYNKSQPLSTPALSNEARKYNSAEVRDKIGTKLQDPYTAEYLPTNNDGTITLYHSTTKEGAEKIKQSGIFGSKTEGGDIYFTTNKKGYGGIGKDKDVVLAFNVDPKKVKFDDVYRGELHLKGNNADIGGLKPTDTNIPMLKDIPKELQPIADIAKKHNNVDDFLKQFKQ